MKTVSSMRGRTVWMTWAKQGLGKSRYSGSMVVDMMRRLGCNPSALPRSSTVDEESLVATTALRSRQLRRRRFPRLVRSCQRCYRWLQRVTTRTWRTIVELSTARSTSYGAQRSTRQSSGTSPGRTWRLTSRPTLAQSLSIRPRKLFLWWPTVRVPSSCSPLSTATRAK